MIVRRSAAVLLAAQLAGGAVVAAQPAATRTPTLSAVSVQSADGVVRITLSGQGALVPGEPLEVPAPPPRLVIDFPGVAHTAPAMTPIGAGDVVRVRIARFSASPLVTRVVFDLARRLPYRVDASAQAQGRIVVVLGTERAAGGTPAKPSPAAASPASAAGTAAKPTSPAPPAPTTPAPPAPSAPPAKPPSVSPPPSAPAVTPPVSPPPTAPPVTPPVAPPPSAPAVAPPTAPPAVSTPNVSTPAAPPPTPPIPSPAVTPPPPSSASAPVVPPPATSTPPPAAAPPPPPTASAPASPTTAPAPPTGTPALPPSTGSSLGGPIVGPQDVLAITLVNSPYSGNYSVGPNGTFEFPLIGEVPAAGLPLREVERELERRLADGYFRNPQLTVDLVQARSRRVFVVGEVRKPGAYSFTGSLTLVEALLRAGSVTADASSNVLILRTGATPQTQSPGPAGSSRAEVLQVDLSRLQSGSASENIPLRDGDAIFVGKSEATRVFVFGDVRTPGVYPFPRGATVLQALELAGGALDRRSPGQVTIVRWVSGKKQEIKARLEDTVQSGDSIVVARGR